MKSHLWFVLLLLAATGCGDSGSSANADAAAIVSDANSMAPDADPTAPDAGEEQDILAFLQSIDGMQVEEMPLDTPEFRFFTLEYQQPADHDEPDGQAFPQHLTLLYRSKTAPVVLYTTGYAGFQWPFRSELARMLDANQISTEQRFFGDSRPDPADWTDLTIANAAADHHRLVEAIRPFFSGTWVASGASKGGMTSLYHRRFYPDDLDAVVAYVAPLSYGKKDPRYVDFLYQVGTADCRDRIRAFQRQVLLRREAMLQRAEQTLLSDGYTFETITLDQALEGAVIEVEFAFWQYQDPASCSELPVDETASDDSVWSWLEDVSSLTNGSDQSIEHYQPYYYQAFTQLGYPGMDNSHIEDLLHGIPPDSAYLPGGQEAPFDSEAMTDVADWIATSGAELMLVYGEFDPWTAGAIDLGDAEDSFLFTVPAGNHGSKIGQLPADQRAEALDAIERWTGVTPVLQRRAHDTLPEPPQQWLRPRMIPRP